MLSIRNSKLLKAICFLLTISILTISCNPNGTFNVNSNDAVMSSFSLTTFNGKYLKGSSTNDSYTEWVGKFNHPNFQVAPRYNLTLTSSSYDDICFSEISNGRYSMQGLEDSVDIVLDNLVSTEGELSGTLENGNNIYSLVLKNDEIPADLVVNGSLSTSLPDCSTYIDSESAEPRWVITAILAGGAAIGAAICAYNHSTASSDCVEAFSNCPNGGTYEFESGYCGGDCTIECY